MTDTDKYEEEIELWIDNFEVTSQSVGDLEQQYEDLLREKTKQMILESEGLDWKSIAYMTARLNVEMGYTCASLIEGSERMIDTDKIKRLTNILLFHRHINKNEADDYLELITEAKRLRDGIRLILSEETAYDLEVFERKLMELIE